MWAAYPRRGSRRLNIGRPGWSISARPSPRRPYTRLGGATCRLFEVLDREDPTEWLLDRDEPAARWVTLTPSLGLRRGRAGRRRCTRGSRAASADADAARPAPRLGSRQRRHAATTSRCLRRTCSTCSATWACASKTTRASPACSTRCSRTRTPTAASRCAAASAEATTARWGALLCDTHAIADVLLRFGRRRTTRACNARSRPRAPTSPKPSRDWRGPAVPHRQRLARSGSRRRLLPADDARSPQRLLARPCATGALRKWSRSAHTVARALARARHVEALHVRARTPVQAGEVAAHLVRRVRGGRHARAPA